MCIQGATQNIGLDWNKEIDETENVLTDKFQKEQLIKKLIAKQINLR